MQSISVFNNKGGVGKTTLTFHLAHALAELGKRTLIVDLDPQCNLTIFALNDETIWDMWSAEDAYIDDFNSSREKDPATFELMLQSPRSVHFVLKPSEDGTAELPQLPPLFQLANNLHLLPGRLTLHLYEDKIASRWSDVYQGDPLAIRTVTRARSIAEEYSAKYGYDVVIFDTSPSLGALNKAVISLVDGFVIPCNPDIQVEQDLVICRALVELFSNPVIAKAVAFRGGTALYKLYIKPPARYSEDIDLVQMTAEPAGPVMEAIRSVLDPWLGVPRWKQTAGRVTFVYRFESEDTPPITMRLKVEANTREHFAVHGFKQIPFNVSSRWFTGKCEISTYELDELMGTKMRALYQRKKSRDLFDLATALDVTGVEPKRIVETFLTYMKHGGHAINRKLYTDNIEAKLSDAIFTADISPLLAQGYPWNLSEAASLVTTQLVKLIPEK